MQKKPVFHLFIPRLFDSLKAWHHDFLFEVNADYLSTLLTQVTKTNNKKCHSIDSVFFNTLQSETEELPIAYYRHQVQVGENLNGLICADPIYLEVGMNDVTLTDKITDLTDGEAKELIEILNKHFAQDGLEFIFGSNQCWYVSFPEAEIVRSYDLDSVLQTNITEKFVQSEQRNWQVIQNETQMLLHSSEVNEQREIAGLKPVNSLWFWGAGKPLDSKIEIEKIYSTNENSSCLRGQLYAKAAHSKWDVLPKDMLSMLEEIDKDSGTHMIILEQLFIPTLENKLDDFQQQLDQIDSNIIKPLLNAWQNNKIDIVIDCCDGSVLKPQKVPAWKFWTNPKNLREIHG